MTDACAPIPAELRRRVLAEAGHRCVIPACRRIEAGVHQIVPREQPGDVAYENLVALCPECQRKAGRSEIAPGSLRIYKANLRYIHDKFSQIEVDMLFELYRAADGQGVQWPPYLMLLVTRLLESGYAQRVETPGGVFIGGVKSNPDLLVITQAGRNFVDSLEIGHDR